MNRFNTFFLLIASTISIASCSKSDSNNENTSQSNFFIINEGNYNATSGDINTFVYDKDTLLLNSYYTANNKYIPANNTQTLEFGTIYNHNVFLAVKAAWGTTSGEFVIADENTLLEKARLTGKDWRAFVGLDSKNGLVSTANGVFKIDLSTFTLGDTVRSLPITEIGEMATAGSYIFAASSNGTYVLNKSDLSLKKSFPSIIQGFTQIPNGKLYGESATGIVQIDPNTLDTLNIKLVDAPRYNQYSWTPSSITSSSKSNDVFVATDENTIYKYPYGGTATLSTSFIQLPEGKYFYGSGIKYDKVKNQIIAIATTDQYGSNENYLYFYNATNGALENTIHYTGYYYPSTIVFHN